MDSTKIKMSDLDLQIIPIYLEKKYLPASVQAATGTVSAADLVAASAPASDKTPHLSISIVPSKTMATDTTAVTAPAEAEYPDLYQDDPRDWDRDQHMPGDARDPWDLDDRWRQYERQRRDRDRGARGGAARRGSARGRGRARGRGGHVVLGPGNPIHLYLTRP